MRMEYFSPNGEGPILFGYDPPYGLVRFDGLGDTRANPVTSRGPSQRGSTLRDVEVTERVISITVSVQAVDGRDITYWRLRSALDRALVIEPGSFGNPPAMGLLRFYKDGGEPPLELPCVPRNSPQYGTAGPYWVDADIEFVAPYPFPRETQDRVFNVAGSGGFEFPIEMTSVGFEMPSYNITVPVQNTGDVRAPVLVRFYGDVTNPVLYNDTTGEHIDYIGQILASEYLEINTEYGNKYAEKVVIATGVRTNVMGNINWVVSKFWSLQRGTNNVRFAASVNAGGYGNVYWRQRYGGM